MGRVFDLRDADTGKPIGTLVTIDEVHAGAFARHYLRLDRVQIEPAVVPVVEHPAETAEPAKPDKPTATPKRGKR